MSQPQPDQPITQEEALAAIRHVAASLPCECAITGQVPRCGNCDFAPRLRPRLSLTLAADLHDAIDPSPV